MISAHLLCRFHLKSLYYTHTHTHTHTYYVYFYVSLNRNEVIFAFYLEVFWLAIL